MTASYAYLVVERQRYPTDALSEAKAPGSRDTTLATAASDSFPDRLRAALDAAARSAGYGSLERLMGSVRGRGRSTPSRAQHVQGLLDAGLLNDDAEISQMASGAVPDPAWEVLGAIQPSRGRRQQIPELATKSSSQAKMLFIDSWSIALHASDGVTPIDVDPVQVPGGVLPVALIAQNLDALSAEGWEVIHVSEDRSIDDNASASHVVCQRILLRR